MRYIYLGRTKDVVDAFDPIDDQSFAGKLLAAANQLGLKGLKKMCEVSISKKISRESVVSLLHLAHDCSAAKLKSACLNFAARNRLGAYIPIYDLHINHDTYKFLKNNIASIFLLIFSHHGV